MLPAYPEICTVVESLAPTWRKTQVVNAARLMVAMVERPSLCVSELARALPEPEQPLHGRLKRVGRFLDNPRLDELALSARFVKLSYRFGADLPDQGGEPWLLPILLDTTYFEPFAALVATVPCGSRGLPLALTTYHRRRLVACFPPERTWPDAYLASARVPRRRERATPAASRVTPFDSQNLIEERLIALVWHLLSPAVRGVLVADRGFARASLFRWLSEHQRAFVIRMDAETHVYLHPDQPSAPVAQALALRPGESRWCPAVAYGQDDRIPLNLLGLWERGHKEPWYLVSSLDRADWTERLYRWRMRIEAANRDVKTGVLLREGGDDHRLRQIRHVHRLLLVLCLAEWLTALVGLQALRDLPQSATPLPVPLQPPLAPSAPATLPAAAPSLDSADSPEPALPPPVLPHRGRVPKLPRWLRRFAAWGHLSFVRLGMEVLRAPDLRWLIARAAAWLRFHLDVWTPAWRPWQRRYRLRYRWRSAA